MRVLRSTRVVTGAKEIAAAVYVLDGRIVRVTDIAEVTADAEVVELGDMALLPGFVDSHVHINEPGRADWEGFDSATRAAAAGGVTTLVDMPLNSIPATTSVAALSAKLAAAAGQLSVDVAFWGGVVPGNLDELAPLFQAGVAGFKCFLAPSGADEFPHVTYMEMEAAMSALAPLDAPLLVHAEDPDVLARTSTDIDRSSCAQYAATRPAEVELEAVRGVIRGAERSGAHVHVVHVSVPESLDEIAAARSRGVRITAETCPHYLWFAAEDAARGAVELKCAPPVRDRCNRRRLRAALRAGLIDLVVSDHSPCPREKKGRGDFLAAWGGIPSLEIAPRVTWTVAAEEGCSLAQLSEWTAAAPARLAGLSARKGAIEPGLDADFAVLDADAEVRVSGARLHHRHKLTPYDGALLRGRVVQTWLRGRPIYTDGEFSADRTGTALLRGAR